MVAFSFLCGPDSAEPYGSVKPIDGLRVGHAQAGHDCAGAEWDNRPLAVK